MFRCISVFLLLATPVLAHDPTIDRVKAEKAGSGWRFDVTITHAETGWDDYADGWAVLAPDGRELGMRVLAHPHENEQPFTRSLSGVDIPEGTSHVFIRARTNKDGWGKAQVRVDLNW